MNWQGISRRGWALRLTALLAMVAAGTLLAVGIAGAQDPTDPGDLPVNPQWLANTLTRASTTSSVQNNLADDAIASRDKAVADWKAAQAAARAHRRKAPSPLAKPEYLVVW